MPMHRAASLPADARATTPDGVGRSSGRPFVRRPWALTSVIALMLLGGCGQEPTPLAPPDEANQLPGADRARGRTLIAHYGCVACHTVPHVRGPTSKVGPPLEGFALRAYVGGVLANTPANLVRWLLDPPAISPQTVMPNLGMSKAEAQDIAAYLLTLR